MTDACREVEVLLSLGAAGALEGADAARLEAHLQGCPACRAERDQLVELLGLARLPPPGAEESAMLADLSSPMLQALRRRERRGMVLRRALAGGAVAAAVALALLAPALLRSRGPSLQPAVAGGAVQVASAAWEEPDMTTLWNESAVLDYGSGSSDGGLFTEAAYTTGSDGW
jgi:anti-sigma factor RsiW